MLPGDEHSALLSYPKKAILDAAPAAELSGELGYPASTDVMQQRIACLSHDHTVYLACLAGEIAGWIDVSATHHLQSDPRAEIGG